MSKMAVAAARGQDQEDQTAPANPRRRSSSSGYHCGTILATAQSGGPGQAAQGAFGPRTQIFFRMHFKCPNVQILVYHVEIMTIIQSRGVLGVPAGAKIALSLSPRCKKERPRL